MPEVNDPIFDEIDRQIEKYKSKGACAKALGVHPSVFSEILHHKANIPPRMLEKLGYMKITVHVKNDRVPAVVRAIEKAVAA